MKLILRWLLGRFYLHICTLGVDENDVSPRVKNIAVWGTAAFLIGIAVLCVVLTVSAKSIIFGLLALLSIMLAIQGVRFYLKNK